MTKNINLVKKLVQISSVSGQEENIQKYIYQQIINTGLNPIWVKNNLVVKIYGKDSTKAMLFDAHVDTVTSGDDKKWKHLPLSGLIYEGKLYGLGASDEKIGVASLVVLAEKLYKNTPPCDVWLMFVTKEEVDGSGTKDSIKWLMPRIDKYQSVSGILVEPTGLKSIEIGHKGNTFIKLTVEGDSGHGSKPEVVKNNSVLIMSQILLDIKNLQVNWDNKYNDALLGKPSIGIGTSIQAGDIKTPNKFPDFCTATLDIRTIPMMHKNVMKELKRHLSKYPVKIENVYKPAPFGHTDKDDALVKAIVKVLPKVGIHVSTGSTDQCFFTQSGIPAVIFGPGEKNCIHKEDEYCHIGKLDIAVDLYLDIIGEWSKNI